MHIEIKGLDRLIRKLNGRVLLYGPLREFFVKATGHGESKAKIRAPYRHGTLRRNIYSEVDSGEPPKWGRVWTDITSRGFAYGSFLDRSARTHYRAHELFSGNPTQGWFSKDARQDSMPGIRALLAELSARVKAIWDGA